MEGRWISVRRAQLRRRLARRAAVSAVAAVNLIMVFEAVLLLLFWKTPGNVDSIFIRHSSFCGVVSHQEMLIDVENCRYYQYNMPGYWLDRDEHAENQGYQIVRPLDQKDLSRFIAAASRYGFWSWRGWFDNRNVLDGDSWEIVVTYRNGRSYSVGGYVAHPLDWNKVSKEFYRLTGEWL